MSDENTQEVEIETEIVEYSKTEAALAGLEEKFGMVADCTTKEGYEFNRKAIAEVRGYRTSLDKVRKDLGEDARKHISMLNSEAKRITERLVAIEQPMKDAKQAIDDEEERIKAEEAAKEEKRVLGIETEVKRIHELSNCPRTMEAITRALSEAEKIDPNDGFFEEFMPAAKIAKDTATVALQELRDEAQLLVDEANRVAEKAEKQAEEQKRLDAEREAIEVDKKAAQDKLDAQQVEMDKKQKAMDDQQAEIDRKEQEKKDEEVRLATEKADKEQAEQEAKETAEREAQERKDAEEKILADRKRYANDEAELSVFAEKIVALVAGGESIFKDLDTKEAKEIMSHTAIALDSAADMIINSAVVKSQQTMVNENE